MTVDAACPATLATWSALGTYVQVVVERPEALDAAERSAREVLDAVDRACSRFRADSDLVRANRGAGSWVAVHPLLAAAVLVAIEAAEQTDGLVDPGLGRALAHVGYDRDLARLPAVAPDPVSPPRTSTPGAWREIEVDPEGALRVPRGCTLDLGATGKAWAADLVARCIVERTGSATAVSLGGDVRVDGPSGAATAWPVEMRELPTSDPTEESVLVVGGIATSSALARRWVRGGLPMHHLLDPRTGMPTAGPWRTVTATGHTCVAANTASTAAMVLGPEAQAWLTRRRVAARLVAIDGRVLRLGGWPAPEVPAQPGGTRHTGRPPRGDVCGTVGSR